MGILEKIAEIEAEVKFIKCDLLYSRRPRFTVPNPPTVSNTWSVETPHRPILGRYNWP